MGDGHRPAALDLPAKGRDHRPGGVQHVAEPNGREAGRHVATVAERFDDPLAERLRLTHDRLRIHGLVGRDQHEPLDVELGRQLRDGARADDVVPYRLEGMRLHQRHVLVRGGVEDDRGPVLLEDLAPERLPVLDVDELRHRGREVALVDELALDVEQRRLGVVDEDQPRRIDTGDLTAELCADRAAGTRDEHGLFLQVRGDAVEVDLHLLAAEDVLDLDGADLPGEVEVA